MSDDDVWRRRFQLFAIMRISGLAFFLFGIAIAFTDLLKPGGWPLLGGLLAIVGALEAVLVPRVLKRTWKGE
jgi:hypothetical protein